MNELMNTAAKAHMPRWQLLTTASVFSLLGTMLTVGCAAASNDPHDTDKPMVWIELGGQLERIDGGVQRFSPPFFSRFSPAQLASPLELERPSRYSNGGEGKISFVPAESDWTFSAAIRYGRTESKRHLHQEYAYPAQPSRAGYDIFQLPDPNVEDTATSERESHAIVDFQAARDVGLGLLGHDSESSISLGVRAVEFHSTDTSTVYARPRIDQIIILPFGPFSYHLLEFHDYFATAETTRNFRGLGPSVEWHNSLPLLGNLKEGELSLDWGLSGAVLFGRQKVIAEHQTSAGYQHFNATLHQFQYTHPYDNVVQSHRAHSILVPNVGGFVGVTYGIQNFKFALGYRGDFFFGAIDGGIDARKTYDRDFYGPFAKVSVGL